MIRRSQETADNLFWLDQSMHHDAAFARDGSIVHRAGVHRDLHISIYLLPRISLHRRLRINISGLNGARILARLTSAIGDFDCHIIGENRRVLWFHRAIRFSDESNFH